MKRVILALAGMAVAIAVLPSCTPAGTGVVIGDSVVAQASDVDNHDPGIPLRGFPGFSPATVDHGGGYTAAFGVHADLDWVTSGTSRHPQVVGINWNGNNPSGELGTEMLAEYRKEICWEISYFFSLGVKHVVLISPLPSVFNDAGHGVDPGSQLSRQPGEMLGSGWLDWLYRDIAAATVGVSYTNAPAAAIYPGFVFDQAKAVDYIHLKPEWSKVYARALRAAVGGND